MHLGSGENSSAPLLLGVLLFFFENRCAKLFGYLLPTGPAHLPPVRADPSFERPRTTPRVHPIGVLFFCAVDDPGAHARRRPVRDVPPHHGGGRLQAARRGAHVCRGEAGVAAMDAPVPGEPAGGNRVGVLQPVVLGREFLLAMDWWWWCVVMAMLLYRAWVGEGG